MTDITPSPAANGPFTLARETTGRPDPPAMLNLIAQKHAEGLSLSEIGQFLLDQEAAAHAAGQLPNV
jgi:hypothetical protein